MAERTISPNATTQQIGTAIGAGGIHTSSTIASLSLTIASGSGSIRDFFPWDYYPYYAYDYYPYDYYPGYYADVEPYYYGEGVYSDTPVQDPTVSAVQTDLTQKGYFNGPIDGIYGPATRDAVAKYQISKGLDVTGIFHQIRSSHFNCRNRRRVNGNIKKD